VSILVKGGPAGGATKIMRPKPSASWRCSCGVEHKPYLARCERCRDRRRFF